MSASQNELFMAGCGVFAPWTVRIVHTDGTVVERTFDSPYALVGSAKENDLCLRDPEVSRRHAYLQALPGGVFCIDLGSRLGTRFNDVVQLSGWLRPEQPLQIGPFKLMLEADNRSGWLASSAWAPEDPLADRAIETTPLAPVVGDVGHKGKILAQWRMKRVLGLVGRLPECLVSVQHKSLSRFHCSLVRTPVGLWVVDLLSRRGTILNGKRVRCARIQDQDQVQAGRYTLRFWYKQKQPKVVPQLPYRPVAPPSPITREPPPPFPVAVTGEPQPKRSLMVATQPSSGEGDRALILALVSQFDQMQQHMFDQFQESLMMATRLFASLHQEQMGLVRQELACLKDLTSELNGLRTELAGHLKKTPPAGQADQAAPAIEAPVQKEPAAARPIPPAVEQPTPTVAGTSVPSHPSPAATDEVHDWLTHRIASLQDERQTRWNKLLGMILGG